jgi:hypothetical protein
VDHTNLCTPLAAALPLALTSFLAMAHWVIVPE